MALRDIQEKAGVFEASNDALCLGLKDDELDYLRGIKVEATDVRPFGDIKEIGMMFNVMVIALDMDVFRLFGIIERYIGALLSSAKIVARLKMETELESAKNVVAELSRPLKLQPEQYVEADGGIWLVLSRI